MRRDQRKAETREQVLQAAEACLEADPLATLAAVGRAAGVAKGTVFHHFPSREALLDALRARWDDALRQELAPRLLEFDPQQALAHPEALVRSLAEATLDAWEARRGLLECLIRSAAARQDLAALRDGLSPTLASFLRNTLEGLAVAHDVTLARPDLVTHGLLGLWTRVSLRYLFRDDVSREEAVDVLTHMTLGAATALLPLSRLHPPPPRPGPPDAD